MSSPGAPHARVGKPAKLGEHPDFEYGAFVTNTAGGQAQFLDARYRTQAHVEDRVKQFKARDARNLPSIDHHRNTAWPHLAALAPSLTAWPRHLGLDGELVSALGPTRGPTPPLRPEPARPDNPRRPGRAWNRRPPEHPSGAPPRLRTQLTQLMTQTRDDQGDVDQCE